jgi:hypothetical protein
MTNEDKQRIEKDADEWFKNLRWTESYKEPLIKESYIAGATTELERSEKLLEEYKEKNREAFQILKELCEYSPEIVPNKGFRDAHNRAKSLIETTSKPERQ